MSLILILAVFLFAGCRTCYDQGNVWEYKTISLVMTNKGFSPDEEINRLSGEGWKVLSFSVTEPSPNIWTYHYFLKRHKVNR
jgi:hypothetical protein